MKSFWWAILFAVILFAGCLSTAPLAPRLDVADPLHDPFADALTQTLPLPVESFSFEEPNSSENLSPQPTETTVPLLEEVPPPEEITLEPEVAALIPIAEQAELLSQNQWVKNIAYINLLDTGKKTNFADLNPEARKRQDEINRLNMSQEELAKRNNTRYEYVDGSASRWRWMHSGVDKLHTVGVERRENSEFFLRDPQYKDKKHKNLRMNAAILLGRDENPVVQKFLLQLVQSESSPIVFRCAAAEVLGRMPGVTAEDLIPLIDTVKDRDIETTDKKTGEQIWQRQTGNIDVWEELLIAVAEKIDPWEHPCFLEPLRASTYDVRLAAAKIWRRKSLGKNVSLSKDGGISVNASSPHPNPPPEGEGTFGTSSSKEEGTACLPEEFLEIVRQEGNPLMRVEFIRTLGAWNVPHLYEFLEHDIQHRTAEVRNAAMLALADARCREAMPMIKDQLRDSNGATRAAAVSALRKLGAFDEVFKLMNDTDRLVRLEIAPAFAERCTSQTVSIAQSFLSDRDAKVQSATVEAVSGWSIEESGPLLLSAAKSFHSTVRCRAVEILAERGVLAAGFDPEDRPENQSAQYEELVQVFRESTGIDPELELSGKNRSVKKDSAMQQVSAISSDDGTLAEVRRCLDDWQDRSLPQNQRQLIARRLADHGDRLMPLIDHLMTAENRNIPESLDSVFAEAEPMFRQIEHLQSGDLVTQRRGAAELAKLGAVSTPSKLAAKRIVNLAAKQTDPPILVSLLSSLKNADPELVCQLARPLLQAESAEVRRLSCEMLKQFGSSEDVALLLDALADPSRSVVRGALSAVDTLLEEGAAENEPIVETLKAMLLQSDPMVQTDVAATLHRLGLPEGADTLRRLAVSGDVNVKAYVASTVSGLGDSAFIPILTRFLDDGNATVRNKALEGLPKLTGKDVGNNSKRLPEVSRTQDRIDRWRAWGKEQNEAY